MFIAGVVCLCLAVFVAGSAGWTMTRPRGGNLSAQVLRSMVPTQLAAAVILGAGGAVALFAAPSTGLIVMIVCILGALGTVAAGSWQGARFVSRQAEAPGCGGSCAGCSQVCAK
jgi:hypothetical protein